jgi:hypothetical protein
MQLTKTHKILIVVIVILALVSLYMLFTKRASAPAQVNNTNATSTSQKIPGTDLSIQSNGDYTITQVPVGTSKTIAMPDLNRPVIFSSTVSLNDEAKKIITEKITSLQTSLKKDPKNIINWVQLGVDQKIIGDFDGAILSWKYAGDVSSDFIAYGNLGNLYAYYLKDNGMAEMYYKKAISRGPTQAYLYIQLSSVYKEVFGDKIKALAILEEGLVKMPNDPALLEAKKNL